MDRRLEWGKKNPGEPSKGKKRRCEEEKVKKTSRGRSGSKILSTERRDISTKEKKKIFLEGGKAARWRRVDDASWHSALEGAAQGGGVTEKIRFFERPGKQVVFRTAKTRGSLGERRWFLFGALMSVGSPRQDQAREKVGKRH